MVWLESSRNEPRSRREVRAVPFPAVDPEPPPRPLWRRALGPVAVVAAVALVVVLAVTLPGAFSSDSASSAARPASWTARVPGMVIGWDASSHKLLAMNPTGTLRDPSVLATGIANSPTTSSSGFALLVGSGRYFNLENRHLKPGPPNYPPGSFSPDDVYGQSPFAGQDNYIVVGGQGFAPEPQPPAVISVYTGNRQSMPGAPVDQVAGDPAKRGAWVSIAHGLPTGTDQNPQQPDSRIEQRRPHHAPVTLATSAELARAAGFHHAGRLELTPYPSPSGKEIAVDVLSTGVTAGRPESVVVLTRTGHVVGHTGAINLQQLRWSSDGSRLLVLQSPNIFTTWQPGPGPPAPVVRLPSSAAGWGSCVFSPFGTYVVCAAFTDGLNAQPVSRWALLRLSDRAVVTEPAHQIPVDWSP
jgi:hypothetical protein